MLRFQFANQLMDRVDAIREQLGRVGAVAWSLDEAEALHRLVHGMTGAAGTFGMHSLSGAARALEAQIALMIRGGGAPDDHAWASAVAGVERLEKVARRHLEDGAPNLKPLPVRSRAEGAPLVYLVEDDPVQAGHLAQVLREAGYRAQVCADPAAFRDAFAAERPAAVVMDMIFPESDILGAALIREYALGRQTGIPVVVLSVRDDLQGRLAAFRAGACRYLAKPVLPDHLVDLLDALTGRQPAEPYRALLVDDDPLLLEAQAAVLREAGMSVQTLSEPLLTLDRVESFDPDVLVLDVYMPDATGPELAAVLRERDDYLHLPILFLSAETDMSHQLLALNLGGDDFLVKPVQPDHLVAAIVARARRSRQNRAIRRRLETTLYEREREHLALDQHAIVSIADAAGNITYVNDRFCQISGYSRNELLGQNHRIVKSGEHPPEFYAAMWETISAGRLWQGEVCNRGKDGHLYWVESTIAPFLDDDGIPYQYVSLRTDITHVKRTEAALRAQNAMRAVVGEAAAGLLASGADTLDVAIEQALRLVGEHLGADRAYLFQLSANDTHMSNSHEWCAPGIAPQKGDLQDMPREIAPWWWAQILRDQPVVVPDVAALPPEAAAEKAMFQSLGIPALSGFPIRRGDRTLGFIGFDHQAGVSLDATSLDLLRLLAGQVGSALLRTAGEQALAENAERLNATLESIKDGILAVDDKGSVLFMNQQFRRMWNMPETLAETANEEALLAHALTQLVDPRGFMDKVQALYRSDEASEDLIEMHDGRVLERHSRALQDGGTLSGRVWSFHDITERRRSEQAAEAAKDRLRRGQLYANIGTWEWNIVSGELYWTERIAPLFGYPLGDLETSYDNFLAAVHPDDRQAVIDAVGACVERDAPYVIEHRVVWPDGSVRWLLERGAVQRDAEGKPLNMIGVVQDIDDRKRAELALAERERQLLEAQRLASIGNWTADLVSGALLWSDEIYRIFGHEPGSFAPSVAAFHAAVHPEDRELVHESEKEAQETGRHDVVHRIVRPDGSIRHVRELAQMHLDEAGKPLRLTGTVQDVTERVEFEQALIAAREAADRANQAKSEFLSSMSHELRTPMNAILGFGQLMEYDDTLPSEHLDSVKEILKAGQHLLGLINEVLDLAKVESGKIDLSLEPVDIFPVVEECIGLVTPMADRRGIALSHEGLAGAAVRADRVRLKQALLNLLSNAIKYNRDGGTVRLDVKLAGANCLRIRVTDTGEGIPAGRLAELFQPFSRLGAEAGEIEGTGIGLTITRRIVEMMGGSVDVDSEVGMGSSFWIELPLETQAAACATAEGMPSAHIASARPAMAEHRIVLYIEDNPANLRLVAQILGRVPHIHLLTAHTPGLGIELALARRPELILLDINMPRMDGYQVLEVFKAEASLKDIPVVAITANAMARDIERGRAAGFSDYLTKPLDVEQFLDTVQRCLADRQGSGQDGCA